MAQPVQKCNIRTKISISITKGICIISVTKSVINVFVIISTKSVISAFSN